MLLAAAPLLLLLTGAELNPKKSKSEERLLPLEEESPEKKQNVKSKLDVNLNKWCELLLNFGKKFDQSNKRKEIFFYTDGISRNKIKTYLSLKGRLHSWIVLAPGQVSLLAN